MRLTFCGDVSIAAAIRSRWETISAGELLGGVAPLFCASDQVFVNLECALTDQAAPSGSWGPISAHRPGWRSFCGSPA